MVTDESSAFVLAGRQTTPKLDLVFEAPRRPGFLSIVIPVYNDATGLTNTLRSLSVEGPRRDQFEIIVVNDGGAPDVTAVCDNYKVRCISQVPNQGSYAARNCGITAAVGEFIALLDADVVAANSWLAAAFSVAASWDITAGRVRMQIPPAPSLTQCYQAVSFFPERGLLREFKFITTANVVVHRKVFEEIGGFDSRLRSGGDYEFSRRAADAGYTLGFSPDLKVLHPCRNYEQLVSSIHRTLYGMANLKTLYGNKFANSPIGMPSVGKLLLPRRNIFQNDVPELDLTPWLKTKLFFFAWWLKWMMIPMVLRIRKKLK